MKRLTQVSVQPDESYHAAADGDDRAAVTTDERSNDNGRQAHAHHGDVGTGANLGVTALG
jgi:hypothetical protein